MKTNLKKFMHIQNSFLLASPSSIAYAVSTINMNNSWNWLEIHKGETNGAETVHHLMISLESVCSPPHDWAIYGPFGPQRFTNVAITQNLEK